MPRFAKNFSMTSVAQEVRPRLQDAGSSALEAVVR